MKRGDNFSYHYGDAMVAATRDDLLYTVGCQAITNSFCIYDMTNPAHPVLKGNLNVGHAYGIALNGNYAYVQTSGGGTGIFSTGTLGMIDTSDPAHPTAMIADAGGYSDAYATYFHDNHVYNVSSDIIGIHNVSNPAALVHVLNISTTGCWWAAFSGDYMYAVDKDWFKIWNIANPAAPVCVGSNQQSGILDSGGVAVKGNHAYAMGMGGKICIYDISTPATLAAPVTIQLQQTNANHLEEARVLGNFLLVAGQREFHVLDISTPASPQQVAWFPVSGPASYGWGFAVLRNRYAIVADNDRYLVLKLW